MDYRHLTEEEIIVLENNSCWSEDWTHVKVAENFKPNFFHRVMFYGDIYLGNFEKSVEVSKGFVKHSGINNATLRNVTVGDNCLIENIGNYINNYTIGNDCYISNICHIFQDTYPHPIEVSCLGMCQQFYNTHHHYNLVIGYILYFFYP